MARKQPADSRLSFAHDPLSGGRHQKTGRRILRHDQPYGQIYRQNSRQARRARACRRHDRRVYDRPRPFLRSTRPAVQGRLPLRGPDQAAVPCSLSGTRVCWRDKRRDSIARRFGTDVPQLCRSSDSTYDDRCRSEPSLARQAVPGARSCLDRIPSRGDDHTPENVCRGPLQANLVL
ncbi:hypothetical protein D3C78_1302100 [compost metagenome]